MIEEPKLKDCLDFGQGDDDDVYELFYHLNQMFQGFYGLRNFGDDWWEAMNQDSWFCEQMVDAWENVDIDALETALELSKKLMIGTYVRLKPFTESLEKICLFGYGHRPRRKGEVIEDK